MSDIDRALEYASYQFSDKPDKVVAYLTHVSTLFTQPLGYEQCGNLIVKLIEEDKLTVGDKPVSDYCH